jgi:hypothetical protein
MNISLVIISLYYTRPAVLAERNANVFYTAVLEATFSLVKGSPLCRVLAIQCLVVLRDVNLVARYFFDIHCMAPRTGGANGDITWLWV